MESDPKMSLGSLADERGPSSNQRDQEAVDTAGYELTFEVTSKGKSSLVDEVFLV